MSLHRSLSLLALVTSLLAAGCSADVADEAVGESDEAVTAGRIELKDVDAPGAKLQTWGYDIKQDGRSRALKAAVAREIFGEIGMNLLRVPVRAAFAHPTRGYDNIVTSEYADDLKAIANAKAVKADLPIFASVKLLGAESFPSWVEKDGEVDPAKYSELIEDYLAYMKANGVTVDWLGVDNERRWNEGNITPAKYAAIVGAVKTWCNANSVKVPGFIAAEDYGPGDSAVWLNELARSPSGFGPVDRVGVHTYTKHREDSYLKKLGSVSHMPFPRAALEKFSARRLSTSARSRMTRSA